jgi:hypothetical protein
MGGTVFRSLGLNIIADCDPQRCCGLENQHIPPSNRPSAGQDALGPVGTEARARVICPAYGVLTRITTGGDDRHTNGSAAHEHLRHLPQEGS